MEESVRAPSHEEARGHLLEVHLGRLLVGQAPELLGELASRGTWRRLARGERLFEKGEVSDGWYLVVAGRLLVLGEEAEGEPDILNEIRAGATVGELTILLEQPRSATVIAARETHLVRFETALFNEFIASHPEHMMAFVSRLIERIMFSPPVRARGAGPCLAILPLDGKAPVEPVAEALAAEFRALGAVHVLTSRKDWEAESAEPAEGIARQERFSFWLESKFAEQERVVLVADPEDTAWFEMVMAQADRVLIVADARGEPPALDRLGGLARPGEARWDPPVWLALVQPPGTPIPQGTQRWLEQGSFETHFHLRALAGGGFGLEGVGRLARFLTERAVGIALSGGGGRGYAHIGVVKALREAGHPIDFYAGTSAGSVVAGMLAYDEPIEQTIERAERGAGQDGRPFSDYTLPMIALLRSRRLEASMKRAFGETMIEDLWLPCEVVATDLTTAERRVFRHGPLWRAVLASSSPPGVTEPVIIDGHLCCDGGLVAQIPLDVVQERGCRVSIVSSVGTRLNLKTSQEAFPSPWKLAWDRLSGGRAPQEVPTVMEIIVRAMTLQGEHSSTRGEAGADLYFEPPVEAFPLLDFSAPGPLVACGYAYARERLRKREGDRDLETEPRPSQPPDHTW